PRQSESKTRLRVTAPAAIIVRLGDPPILTLIAALLIQIVARYSAPAQSSAPLKGHGAPTLA
ncbi:MAG: hypothetical protein WAN43_10090, partial [Rhodomicrobium sp.]